MELLTPPITDLGLHPRYPGASPTAGEPVVDPLPFHRVLGPTGHEVPFESVGSPCQRSGFQGGI